MQSATLHLCNVVHTWPILPVRPTEWAGRKGADSALGWVACFSHVVSSSGYSCYGVMSRGSIQAKCVVLQDSSAYGLGFLGPSFESSLNLYFALLLSFLY